MDKMKFAIAAQLLRHASGLSQTAFSKFLEKEYAEVRLKGGGDPHHKVELTRGMVAHAEFGIGSEWTYVIYQKGLGLDASALEQLGRLQTPGEPFESSEVKDPSTMVQLALQLQSTRHALGIGPKVTIRFR